MSYKTYDYRCMACGTVEERMVHKTVIDEQACTECTGLMERLISAPRLDLVGMAEAGCPGANETLGNNLEKAHRSVDQMHRKASK